MSKKWYTSDFHLFHDNIVRYCDRPFRKECPECEYVFEKDTCKKCRGTGWVPDIWSMHDAIVNGMNERVAPNDELFILGDVSFYGGTKVTDILKKIHGRKHLIIGNHDAKNMGNWDGWVSVNHYLEIKDKGQNIVLCHYPLESWNKMSYGSIHLHGHRHGTRPKGRENDECPWGLRVDVGVDPWNFRPVCLDDLTPIWLEQGKLV